VKAANTTAKKMSIRRRLSGKGLEAGVLMTAELTDRTGLPDSRMRS
jgi:hypothetical protein